MNKYQRHSQRIADSFVEFLFGPQTYNRRPEKCGGCGRLATFHHTGIELCDDCYIYYAMEMDKLGQSERDAYRLAHN